MNRDRAMAALRSGLTAAAAAMKLIGEGARTAAQLLADKADEVAGRLDGGEPGDKRDGGSHAADR